MYQLQQHTNENSRSSADRSSKAASFPAPASQPVLQRLINIGQENKKKQEEKFSVNAVGALELLKTYCPELFEKDLIDHDDEYRVLLHLMSEKNRSFSSILHLGETLETERRAQILAYNSDKSGMKLESLQKPNDSSGKKGLLDSSSSVAVKPDDKSGKKDPSDSVKIIIAEPDDKSGKKEDSSKLIIVEPDDKQSKKDSSDSSGSVAVKPDDKSGKKEPSDSSKSVAINNYEAEAIQQYRLSMAYGRAWGSEAEATVVADSLGVRFRIYSFADAKSLAPTSNIIVGSGGPIYALHYAQLHYSLLQPDVNGPYLLHGVRYRFVPIAKDGHCLFGAGFTAVTGRSASANDIYSLRAVAASMVPDEIIEQMLVALGHGRKKPSELKHKKAESKEEFSEEEEDFEPSKSVKSGSSNEVKKLQPFMSRINYLLNRYPNLFYPIRSQHTDFGKIIGGYSETRQLFFYNDMLVPKLPVVQEDEQSNADELGGFDEDILMPNVQKDDKNKKQGPVGLLKPLKPLPDLETFETESGHLDISALSDMLGEHLAEMQKFVEEFEKDPKWKSKKMEEDALSEDESSVDETLYYELLKPEEFENYEFIMSEGLKHHNLNDEMDLGKLIMPEPIYFSDQDKHKSVNKFSGMLLMPEDIDDAKAFANRFQYASNDSMKSQYHLPHVREKQKNEMAKLKKDKVLGQLRKKRLKYNDDHAEQLLVSGMAWEAITTLALEMAFGEATLEKDDKLGLSDKPGPNLKNILTPHVFTVVINRSSCSSCTDALIAAIRLFWQTCAELFGMEEQEARLQLGNIFRFELSVTGMYVSSNKDDSTTASDLEALRVSGWIVGLHHDKSGGLSPQGYAFVEALYGKHDRDEVDKMAGRGQPSVKSITMKDKLAVGKARKMKKEVLIARGPEDRKKDRQSLQESLDPTKSLRTIFGVGKNFLELAISEIRNYQHLDSDAFEEAADQLLQNMLNSELFKDSRLSSEATVKQIIAAFLKCLEDLYDLLDNMRTDK